MSIEVTVFVPFQLEPRSDDERMIGGIAEIYGDEDTYDVVALRDDDRNRIEPNSEIFRRIRSDLLFSQSVYDTLKEAIYWEHHGS